MKKTNDRVEKLKELINKSFNNLNKKEMSNHHHYHQSTFDPVLSP